MIDTGISLTNLPHGPVVDHIGPPEESLSGRRTTADLWEMSAMELESILAQTDELVDVENPVDLLTWDNCFTEGVGRF